MHYEQETWALLRDLFVQLLQLMLLEKAIFICKLVDNEKQYLLTATFLDHRQLKPRDKHIPEDDMATLGLPFCGS